MILRRLTLHGFKSFADRTEFEFGSGLTMVVGPNGCGKSNVVDSIKWVLGEQSARSLRGHRMSDVIFSGSRSRKPGNLAEVSLSFDNTDGSLANDQQEVTVTRQLFRSGASEYLINGRPARLKDVRDLFLDTGVGVDAYSMIEQGRVDVLLSASPLERRQIFEEAAGISKYKVRRTEAERKLERARQNLLRLNDVIEEVEKQLRSVKLAAGKARNYQEYDGRLRELRASASLADFHRLKTSLAEFNARRAALVDTVQQSRAELAASDALGAELAGDLQKLDGDIQAGEAEAARVQAELSAVAERIGQCDHRLRDAGELRERNEVRSSEAAAQAARLEERIADERSGIREMDESSRLEREQLARLENENAEAQRGHESWRAALDAAKSGVFDAARRDSLTRNQLNHLTQQRSRLAAEAQSYQQRQQTLEEQSREVEQRRGIQQAGVVELERQAAELTSQVKAVETERVELETQRQQLDARIAEAREARSAVMSRLGLLEDMERRLEGVTEAARAVLGWRDGEGSRDHGIEGSRGGVVGLIADLLRIDNPRIVLIESVLAAFENHLVVENTYAFLSEVSRRPTLPGPVGVFALDRVNSNQAWTSFREHPGFVDWARDWVICEPRFAPLADWLLGRTVIVDTVEHALAMAAAAPPGFFFVTLDGQTISSDGRIVVGPQASAAGLISRKTEIRQLRGELDEIETTLERHARQRAAIAERASDADVQRQSLIEQIARVQKRHGETQAMLVRLDDEAARIERERSLLGGDLSGVRRSLEEIEREIQRVEADCTALAQELAAAERKVESVGAEVWSSERVCEQAADRLTAARIEAGRAAEKRSAAIAALERLVAQHTDAAAEAQRVLREVGDAGARIARLEHELAEAKLRQAALSDECDRRRGDLFDVRQQRQTLRTRVEDCGAASRTIHARIEEGDATIHAADVELREVQVRIETLTQRVRDELSIDLAEAYARYEHQEQDWEAVRAEIDMLRGRIERLGAVNLDAIRELEEIAPRHENLCVQRDDLLSSISRLEALIEELNDESRQRFSTTFEAIREHFGELFRKLFGGGKADIILEDPAQPLECGIEIIARPPGKEPQSISLLSGGEKTMTAVALLLAVFKSKPSPFAIMDEVDAALDEANNERFNNVVQEFLSHSQFIVITHSKVTMHCADVLYGVTMEEAGVSKRVSVRFDDRVPTPSVA